jgi:nitrogen-specific signal transduction histidine kinase
MALKLMDELRNPLVAVGGFAARISDGDYPEHKLKEYTGLIFEESKRLDTALEQAVAHLKAAAEKA